MKMIIVVMMLYNDKDGGNGDNSDNMVSVLYLLRLFLTWLVHMEMVIVMIIFQKSDQKVEMTA